MRQSARSARSGDRESTLARRPGPICEPLPKVVFEVHYFQVEKRLTQVILPCSDACFPSHLRANVAEGFLPNLSDFYVIERLHSAVQHVVVLLVVLLLVLPGKGHAAQALHWV